MMLRWKNSASVILAANLKHNSIGKSIPTSYDYKLLSVKRQKNSSFLPGNYVFPGGTVDVADLDVKWKHLYKKYGFDDSEFSSLFPKTNKTRPCIFEMESNDSQQLPKEISLRITAARETFEECGILLCKSAKKTASPGWINCYSLNQTSLEEWQKKVHKNATEFYNLCETLNCFPDLWALYEWGNWLTPTALNGKRFNTIFFIACLETIPVSNHDDIEIEELSWNFPNELISSSAKFKLAPPQVYEISRISKFNFFNDLLHYAIDFNKTGVDFKLPVIVKLSDGAVYLLPGDADYPANVNLTSFQQFDYANITIDQFRDATGAKHRMEFSKDLSKPRKLLQTC
ncbi:nucleoside diphosphate-linked moiety X motif 19-like [Chelonus insularis]|uniref:nucleoside diphosphate-linked moiety X motif 19-like n=1 Tax=Chelonus insularis TaxID=460826 RepID=UPI00158B0970|nr:nucleoside diphosphate-linked moiety X motif 19-like [Chelonus insularis]